MVPVGATSRSLRAHRSEHSESWWPVRSEPVRPAAATQALIIREVDYDPPGSETPREESVTLFNPGEETIDLLAWRITDNHGAYAFKEELLIAPHGSKVLGGSAYNPDNSNLGIALANKGDFVKIYDQEGRLVDAVCWKKGCDSCPDCRPLSPRN